ncbi:MAG: DUF3098 domain-containing protein [Candidatus Neomarinimicrobiota bacterium]
MVKVSTKTKKSSTFVKVLSFSKINYVIFAIGIAVIFAGYYFMASGATYSFRSLTVAPITLLIGYLVIIPVAILYRKKGNTPPKEN